jgi:DNA polymerase III gamma/tau subunit
MHKIKRAEHINITQEAEEFVLDICNNNAKILINYMEKFKLVGANITIETAQDVCTNISFSTFNIYTTHLINLDINSAIRVIYAVYDRGYSVIDILDNYFLFVKTTQLLTETQKYKIIPCICKYITIFHNTHEHDLKV